MLCFELMSRVVKVSQAIIVTGAEVMAMGTRKRAQALWFHSELLFLVECKHHDMT